MHKKRLSLQALACVPLVSRKLGFAIVLFKHPEDNSAWAAQLIDPVTELISGFAKVDEALNGIVPIEHGPMATRGSAPLLAFFDDANVGGPSVGTTEDISPALRDYLAHGTDPATLLQVAELIGDQQTRQAARLNVFRDLVRRGGGENGTSFLRTSMYSTTWSTLLRAAVDQEAAHRILSMRTSILISIDSKGRISVDISAIDAADAPSISSASIVALLEAEYPIQDAFNANAIEIGRIEKTDADELEAVNELIRIMNRTGRQEERVARYIEFARRNPLYFDYLRKQYLERSSFAESAKRLVDEALRSAGPLGVNWAKLADTVIDDVFPLNRGVLLFYFAKLLGAFGDISKIVEAQTIRRGAENVERQRDLILAYLNAWIVVRDRPEKEQRAYFERSDLRKRPR